MFILLSHKFHSKQWRQRDTEMYCLFTAADSIDDISFISSIVVWSKNKFSPNPAPVPKFYQVRFQPDLTHSTTLVTNYSVITLIIAC